MGIGDTGGEGKTNLMMPFFFPASAATFSYGLQASLSIITAVLLLTVFNKAVPFHAGLVLQNN